MIVGQGERSAVVGTPLELVQLVDFDEEVPEATVG